MSYEKKP